MVKIPFMAEGSDHIFYCQEGFKFYRQMSMINKLLNLKLTLTLTHALNIALNLFLKLFHTCSSLLLVLQLGGYYAFLS